MAGIKNKKQYTKKNLVIDYWDIIHGICLELYSKTLGQQNLYRFIHYPFKKMFLTEEIGTKILKNKIEYIKRISELSEDEMYLYMKQVAEYCKVNLKIKLRVPEYEYEEIRNSKTEKNKSKSSR